MKAEGAPKSHDAGAQIDRHLTTRPSGYSISTGLGVGDRVNMVLDPPERFTARPTCRMASCTPPGGSGK
jgi:hypothetical protein